MELETTWERFDGGPVRSHKERVHITLSDRSVIFMNRNLHWLIGRPTAVNLYYNRDLNQIAIEAANPRLPNVFPVREFNNGHRINAAAFCRHFRIRFAFTHKFLNPVVTEDRRIVLDLNKTSPVFTRRELKKIKLPPPREHSLAVDAMLAEWAKEDGAEEEKW